MRCGILILMTVGLAVSGLPAAESEELFKKQVAPILEKHCLSCHGDAAKGGLSLASGRGLAAGGDSGPVVVRGKPEESLLYTMITGDKPRMPRNARPLSEEQRAVLRKWIAEGAAWPMEVALRDRKHEGETWWSLRPLQRPGVPPVKNAAAVRTPIDAFLLKRLEEKGLAFSPEADRRTLIRRLTFDLHGLPPTPEEVAAFVNDAAPDAHEKLVDRLLASPRYGERWGRHWLDVVHYGDTHGYDKDKRRNNAWPYRDYVVRALNADRPYARFIREQIAGDVIYPGDPEGIIATGFVAAGPWDFVGHVELREGTVEKEKTRVLDRDDMVASSIGTFNSLTVHCARCHAHKFDPIPQEDYYRLQAVFAGVDRGDRPYPDSEHAGKRQAVMDRQRQARDHLIALNAQVTRLSSPEVARIDDELKNARKELAASPPLPAGKPSSTNGYHSSIMPTPEVTKWVQVDLGKSLPIDAVHLIPARPTDFPDTPGFGFPLRYRVELSEDAAFKQPVVIADHTAQDFLNPGAELVTAAAGGRSARYVRLTATRLWKRTNDYVLAVAEMQVESGGKNAAAGAVVSALDSIEAGRWSTRHLVDGFDSRQQLADLSRPEVRPRYRLAERIRRLESERQQLVQSLIDPTLRVALQMAEQQLNGVEAELKALPPAPQVYALTKHAPRPVHVLHRGDVEQKRALAQPGGLSLVPGLSHEFKLQDPSDEGSRRAALAEWIAHPDNVMTWRSIVNRIWHYHFGRGLVDTPNDFGRNGSQPTHPELLDWLAVEFREGGGSLKTMHRLILNSAVYRQASTANGDAARIDAENRLLWRMNRKRLDAEEVRDTVLAVSGQLDLRMGGPGYDLFRFRDDHSPEYDHTALERIHDRQTYRRTIYRFVVRSVPNPFLECLDCADPNLNVPVRNTTLTALQALALLNDPFMLRQAELFAGRLQQVAADPAGRIDLAYQLAFGRPPTAAERTATLAYAARHGMANTCRVLFNANEFVFVD